MTNFDRNLSVIKRRWPKVADEISKATVDGCQWQAGPKDGTIVYKGIRMTSSYDRASEAKVQASTIKEGTDIQWCFGIGLGELPRELLRKNRKTSVIIMNRTFTRASLDQEYHADWLEHKKLILCMASDVSASIRIPDDAPFATAPMEVRHSDVDAYPVRDAVCGAINSRFNRHIQYKAQLPNDLANWEANKALMENDGKAKDLFGSRTGAEMIVCAPGPTLDGQIEWLRQNREGKTLICLNSSLAPLRKAGITPDFCVIIDSAKVIVKSLDGLEVEPLRSCALIYEPVVTYGLTSMWPGPRYYSIDGWLWSKGTVMHAAVDLATKMGASSITLVGVDLCHPKLKSHAADAPDHYDVNAEVPAAMIPTIDGNGEETHTVPCLAMYHRHLEGFIQDHPGVKFYKRGREGVTVAGATWMD